MTTTTEAAIASARTGRRTAVRTVLNTMEWVLFGGDGLTVARANAWAAVQEDRVRARERAEATAVLAGASKRAGLSV